jgi:signal transduction histidine kinase
MARAETVFRVGSRTGGPLLLAGRPLRRLLQSSLTTIGHVAGTRMASLHAVSGDDLVHIGSTGLSPDYVRAMARIPVGVGCCGVAVAEARPVVVEDVPCSRVMAAFQCLCERHGLRSVWCLPLLAGDNRVLGGLAVYHDRPFRPSLEVAREVEVYAETVAAALEFGLDPAQGHAPPAPFPEGTRRMAARFLDVQEAERQRVAEELHDELIQDLVGVQLMLACAPGAEVDPSLLQAATSLGALVARLRELIFELHPLTLESDGLPGTVGALLARLEAQTGIETQFNCRLTGRVPTVCERLAYRVVREGVQNVRRHAAASRLTLGLACRAGYLEVTLTDDGVGFDPRLSAGLNHFGLASIRHQVASVGGTLETISAPGRGTTLAARIPTSLEVGTRAEPRRRRRTTGAGG